MSARRVVTVLLLPAVFGIVMGLFKGDDAGLRSGIGNLSAPWLLVALLPALRCRTMWRGALVGFGSTMAALAGFYAALTVVLAGDLGGGGQVREFLVEAGSNRIYFLAGMVTGPLLGVIGAWVGNRHHSVWVLVVGCLVAGEIAGVALVQGLQLAPPPLYFRWGVDDWTPYIGESLLGLAIIVAAVARRRPRTPAN